MPADHFRLISLWQFDAPVERVWRLITDAEHWPDWCPFVEAVEKIAPGEPSGRHSLWRYTWKTMLPYKLRFEVRITRIEAPLLLEADIRGDLAGRGVCRIARKDGLTRVHYEWDVRTCRPWMNWLAPIARPMFLWNHRKVMERGEALLAMRLARETAA